MKIISHRGNISGPKPNLENTKRGIEIALENNFDVEIDLWKVKNDFFLGHDMPLNEVSFEWLENKKKHLWIHTKNFNAFESLLEINSGFIFFYYTCDPLVLVSNGKIWCHQPKEITNPANCIAPLLSKSALQKNKQTKWYGVCTDYPLYLK
ncbi:hypothetical protein OA958_04210 [Bacteroidota bacterium]|nr:hypothetical protein [Bacteroidota bacterium]